MNDRQDNRKEKKYTQFDILRHGECEGGAIFRGSTDVHLKDKGLEKMLNACRQAREDWNLIVSSPLKRCEVFSRIWAERHNIPLEFDPRLREMHFGLWEARSIEEVWRDDAENICAWSSDPALNTPPEGEGLDALFSRVQAALKEIIEKHSGKKILLVMHGGPVRAILAEVLQMPVNCMNRVDVPYAALSRIALWEDSQGRKSWKLLAHNFIQSP